MCRTDCIYILGAGAVGLALAASLARAGRHVVLVHTSRDDDYSSGVLITLYGGDGSSFEVGVKCTTLSRLGQLAGLVVVTAKAYANDSIARALLTRPVTGPLVVLQNGLGVEQSFLRSSCVALHRCILYVTAETIGANEVTFRAVSPSPIGFIQGAASTLPKTVSLLSTPDFPFREEPDIQREIWQKTIINTVFNSICPLLEVDNGIFARDPAVAGMAREVVREGIAVAERHGIAFTEVEIMQHIHKISLCGEGVLISTLQDLRHGRPTEINHLNLELTRRATSLTPPLSLPRTTLLGGLIHARASW
ncbi:MAG: ketopantoate reductase C-terminal domain-containing protein [Chthoniobacteraceae bacterium]